MMSGVAWLLASAARLRSLLNAAPRAGAARRQAGLLKAVLLKAGLLKAGLLNAVLVHAMLVGASTSAHAAEIALYDTGPAQDAAFVRFVNAGALPVEVTAAGGKAKLALNLAKPASDYLPVRGGSAVKGAIGTGAHSAAIDVTIAPGEFVTVIGVPAANALTLQILRDAPDDFNALKSALTFYSAAPACAKAGLQVAGRAVDLFRDVALASTARRLINPVALSVQLVCNGKPSGAPVSLGALAAGQRYSVFAVPAVPAAPAAGTGARLIAATDIVAR
ncbi:alginate O-acetyltransferase AlgF [Pigmentiphaga litoralis]|uniref:alginate O-acetyltransferase AlgF n=1 Tax=Pigmentiphaga litoralis TaxID=516702 RepID=UPI003B428F8B